MRQEIARIDQRLPISAVLDYRRRSMTETGQTRNNAYDRLMWYVIGNPYDPFGTRTWHETPSGQYLEFGYRLHSGISADGEILAVSGALGRWHTGQPDAFRLHSLPLDGSDVTDWLVQAAEISPPYGVINIRLHAVAQAAGRAITVRLATPSRNDALGEYEDHKAYYNPHALKNLFAVANEVEAKYWHLEALYRQQSEPVLLHPEARPLDDGLAVAA